MNIPNLITMVRFLLVPAVVYAMLHGNMIWALVLFTIAGISDAIDGFIARHFDQQSEIGAWLDPLADKLLLISVFVSLAAMSVVPDWLVFMIVTRDVLIVGAVAISNLVGSPLEVRPILISKANTAAQIILAVLLLAALAFELPWGGAIKLMIWLTAGLTITSGASYLLVWIKHMAETADTDEPEDSR